MSNRSFVVLMAEDSEHDIIATKRAWKKYHIANPLGDVAFQMEKRYIHQQGQLVWGNLSAALLRNASRNPLH